MIFTFEDNFDSYDVGTFPIEGGWDLLYSGAGTGYQIIVPNVYVSPIKSLQLMGRGTPEGSHIAAVAAYPIPWSNRKMSFTVHVMVDEISDTAAIFGFAKRVSDGVRLCTHLRFLENGSIWSQGTVLQSYELDIMYKITLELDTITDTYDVWVDDEIKGPDIEAELYPSSEIELFMLASNFDWTRVCYDNVKVTGYNGKLRLMLNF